MIEEGYSGSIGYVDLTSEKTSKLDISHTFRKKYLGGSGFAVKFLYDELESDVNPLSPKNCIFFGIGPYQGSGIWGSSRWTVCARSPLTGFWADSSGGGHSPQSLKLAGFDSLMISGKAKEPSYLYLHDAEIEIRPCSDIWGMDSFQTIDAVKEDLGKDGINVSSIGQGGENLVRFANIVNNKHAFSGRSGLGAVMGSKNLKAVAIEDTEEFVPHDPETLENIKNDWLEDFRNSEAVDQNRKHGQARAVAQRENNGLLPIKNWKGDKWEKADEISAPKITEKFEIKPWPCEACIMGCHRRITADSLSEEVKEGPGPEYETLGMLGSNLLIDEPEVLIRANHLCNKYGIDTMEMGGIAGLIFECYEEGILSEGELGFKPEWGSGEALLQLIEMTKNREKFGSIVAEGIKATSMKIGEEATKKAMHVKGQSMAAHDPRAFFSMAVAQATSLRGACHLRGCPELEETGIPLSEAGLDKPNTDRFDWKKKGKMAALAQDEMNIYNSLTVCFFYRGEGGRTVTQFTEVLNAITGWKVEPQEVIEIGERITNLQRMFNLEMGQKPKAADDLPTRFKVPHKKGGAAKKVPPLEKMLDQYYETKDWPGGVPTQKKLRDLGIISDGEKGDI